MKKKLKNINLKKNLPQDLVDITEKTRSNLFAWRGQFSPQLIETLIENYGSEGDVLFDPFLGSGTILLEASHFNLDAFGVELNPAAFGLASVYELMSLPSIERQEILTKLDGVIIEYSKESNTIWKEPIEKFQGILLNLLDDSKNDKNITIILRALIIGLDFNQKKIDHKSFGVAWSRLKDIIINMPLAKTKNLIYLNDARKTILPSGSIDLVITSPPYINVFNYHQNYRKSVEAMGTNILEVAKSEIGSNRKFRSNRFFTVIQYALDIHQVFLELIRVCKSNAKIIFIVGRESTVKGTTFSNAKLLSKVAQLTGFVLEGEQPRMFKNKFGENIFEEILRFSIDKTSNPKGLEDVRNIAIACLKESLSYAPQESLPDLHDAIKKANSVEPSILYNL